VSESQAPRPPGLGPHAHVGLGELFVRHARKDGHSVAILRAIDHGDDVTVECEVFPSGADAPVAPGPFKFADARQATAFAIETVEALMYLGCDVQAA
jgi:hypothetical protein